MLHQQKHLFHFTPVLRLFRRFEIKGSGIIDLTEEISNQLNILGVKKKHIIHTGYFWPD